MVNLVGSAPKNSETSPHPWTCPEPWHMRGSHPSASEPSSPLAPARLGGCHPLCRPTRLGSRFPVSPGPPAWSSSLDATRLPGQAALPQRQGGVPSPSGVSWLEMGSRLSSSCLHVARQHLRLTNGNKRCCSHQSSIWHRLIPQFIVPCCRLDAVVTSAAIS